MSDLFSRLEALTAPSRELDAEIALANGWRIGGQFASGEPYWHSPGDQLCPNVPRYTESIDAALTLVPEKTPWGVGTYGDRYDATAGKRGRGLASTPAVALVIACLKARKEEGKS